MEKSKLKKGTSASLALVLALGMTPMAPGVALADEGAEQDGYELQAVSEASDLQSLQDALKNGGSIRLTDDIEADGDLVVAESVSVTLDLNGKKLDMQGHSFRVIGSMTVVDSTAPVAGPTVAYDYSVSYVSGSITTSQSATVSPVCVVEGGSFVLDSGTVKYNPAGASVGAITCDGNVAPGTDKDSIESSVRIDGGLVDGYAYGVVVRGKGAKLTVDGGVIVSAFCAISGDGTDTAEKNHGGTYIEVNEGTVIANDPSAPNDMKGCVYHPQSGNLKITGGFFHAVNGFGVLMRAGDLEITGGTIEATGNLGKKQFPSKGSEVECSGVFLDYSAGYSGAKVESNDFKMTGGSVSSDEAVAPLIRTEPAQDIESSEAVTGGSISGLLDPNSPLEGFLPEGYEGEIAEDGTLTPVVSNPAASIGEVNYPSVQAAIDAAGTESVITLKRDAIEDLVIPKSANITLDLAGCTITNSSDHTITNYGTLTIVGSGVVDNVTHAKSAIFNAEGATADIQGGTYKRSREAGYDPKQNGGNSYYTILNQGTMTLGQGVKVESKLSNGTLSRYSSVIANGWQGSNVPENTGSKAKLTIDGATIEGGLYVKNDRYGVLEMKSGYVKGSSAGLFNYGEMTVSGGTVEADLADKGVVWNYQIGSEGYGQDAAPAELTISGGDLNAREDQCAVRYTIATTEESDWSSVSIEGGDINGEIKLEQNEGDDVSAQGLFSITGGNFSENPVDYMDASDDSAVKVNGDSGYQVLGRGELPEGTYVLPEGAEHLTKEDFAENVDISVDPETGEVIATRPYVPSAPSNPSYDAVITPSENGTVELSDDSAKEGDAVTVTVAPEEGYELRSISVTDSEGNAVELTANADGTYTFEMPKGDVTIAAVFGCDGGDLCASHGFSDVDPDQWYHDAIDWAVTEGVLSGIGGTDLMDPDGTLTRAQMAQVLWNVAGNPEPGEGAQFSDVTAGDWFSGAAAWASSEGIFQGYDGAFDPNSPLTREQAAMVLMRWTEANGGDVTGRADLSAFPDAAEVSGWAADALAWAVDAGVLQGVALPDGTRTLDPQGSATRAQTAALMMRLLAE